MAREPLSDALSNGPGITDRWTCPACYDDHIGRLQGTIVSCSCGHSFKTTLEYEPVCYSALICEREKGE